MHTPRFVSVALLGFALSTGAALAGSPEVPPTPDRPAVAVKRVTPAFPARAATESGQAHVMVEIDPAGKVVSAQVVSATDAAFAASALQAARAWRFEPARKAGQPVASWARLPFKFGHESVAGR